MLQAYNSQILTKDWKIFVSGWLIHSIDHQFTTFIRVTSPNLRIWAQYYVNLQEYPQLLLLFKRRFITNSNTKNFMIMRTSFLIPEDILTLPWHLIQGTFCFFNPVDIPFSCEDILRTYSLFQRTPFYLNM